MRSKYCHCHWLPNQRVASYHPNGSRKRYPNSFMLCVWDGSSHTPSLVPNPHSISCGLRVGKTARTSTVYTFLPHVCSCLDMLSPTTHLQNTCPVNRRLRMSFIVCCVVDLLVQRKRNGLLRMRRTGTEISSPKS